MRHRLRSVRARATLAATLVVAIALVTAGAAVLFSLRANLIDTADAQADTEARKVAVDLAFGVPYAELDLPDADDNPVQVVDRQGRVVAADEDVESMSVVPSGSGQPSGARPTPMPTPIPIPIPTPTSRPSAMTGDVRRRGPGRRPRRRHARRRRDLRRTMARRGHRDGRGGNR